MNVDQVAALAVEWTKGYGSPDPANAPPDRDRAIVMTAIAGAESGYIENARGDKGLSGINCSGYCSFGLWQVYIPAHQDLLDRLMAGHFSPCEQMDWLYIPEYNARCMRDILAGGEPTAWSTYNGGQYLAHMPEATAAVDRYLNPPPPTPRLTQIIRVFDDGSVTVEAQ